MTIKRRLFISNILMLIVPVILSLIVVGIILHVFMSIAGIQVGKSSSGNTAFFYSFVDKANTLANKWDENPQLEQIKEDIDEFNEKYSDNKVLLLIYRGSELVYPLTTPKSSPILDTALYQDGSHTFIMDNVALYRESVGEYTLVLFNDNFIPEGIKYFRDYRILAFNIIIIMFIVTIIIVLLTNRFLTKFVFKRIMTPLDTLVYGVHQIRDGNLSYHIDYEGKDEFTGICSDFNEMAQRLLESVNARQKDEVNRKELIAGISHDLRTPLTSIKAYAEGIEKGVASTPETQKRYLDIIKNKANDLEHIVNQLFLFSKLDIGEFPFYLEKINIGEELASMIDTVSEEYEKKGLAIQLIENVQKVYIKADIVQLRNAIINIMENSVKYKDKDKGEMKIICSVDHEHVIITLADNGPGVSKEAVRKLFDIFYRSDPSRSNPSKGSGLGLSITAKILERLGGAIKAENGEKGGLAIKMIFPKYIGGDKVEKNSDY